MFFAHFNEKIRNCKQTRIWWDGKSRNPDLGTFKYIEHVYNRNKRSTIRIVNTRANKNVYKN